MTENFITFSEICGENVKISESKNEATWVSKTSGGWACSDQEVKPGESITVRVEGSGRCDIGYMKDDQSSRSFKILNEIRANRKTCSIPISFDNNGEEISSNYGDKTYKKRVMKGTNVWIAVYIRYGSITAEILSNESSQNQPKFSSNHGPNIRLENDNTFANPISKTTSSLCFISNQLQTGKTIHLQCRPETEGGREISRYQLKLLVSGKSPDVLQQDHKELFIISESTLETSPLKSIEVFEKDECKGDISVTITSNMAIQYKTAKGKQNNQHLGVDFNNGVWIALDLYGVHVTLSPTAECEDTTIAVDQVDTGGEYMMNGSDGYEIPRPRPIPIGPPSGTTGACGNETGEEMNLKKYYPQLVQDIDTLHFCDHLYAKNIITNIQMDEIHALHKQSGCAVANRELLKMISKKKISKSDMEEIVEAVQQTHLLEKFFPK